MAVKQIETNFVYDGLVPVQLLLPVTPVFDKAFCLPW